MAIQIHTASLPGDLAFDLLMLEGGRFMMGRNGKKAPIREKPAHEVTLSSFYLGQYPVTQAVWETVMKEVGNPSFFSGLQRPVESVSWYDAVAFCNRLSKQLKRTPCYYSDEICSIPYALTGPLPNAGLVYCLPETGGYRLPTEAEWEYAARGGLHGKRYLYAGSNQLRQVGWYHANSHWGTQEVGRLNANELGLYDMNGNVLEWCEDQWHDSYEGAPKDGSAWLGHPQQRWRTLRGGNFSSDEMWCRVTTRGLEGPEKRSAFFGFRLAFSPAGKDVEKDD